MKISAYQVDKIIKAYVKQSEARFRFEVRRNASWDKPIDLLRLSGRDSLRADANQKISYSLLDVLLNDKKTGQ